MFNILIRSLFAAALIGTVAQASDPGLPTILLAPAGAIKIDAENLGDALEQLKLQIPALSQTPLTIESKGQNRHSRPVRLNLPSNITIRETLTYIADLAGYRVRVSSSEIIFDIVDWVGRPPTRNIYLPGKARDKLGLNQQYTREELSKSLREAGLPDGIVEAFPENNRFSIIETAEKVHLLSNALAVLATTNLTVPSAKAPN